MYALKLEPVSDDVSEVASDDEVSVPLELGLSWELLIPVEGELGKEQEDSLMVVCGELGYDLAVWESLGVSSGSLRSEYLVITLVSHIQFEFSSPVSSRGVPGWSYRNVLHTAHWVVLKPGLLGLFARLTSQWHSVLN